MLADADADDQRAALAHAPEPVRMLGVENRQRKAAFQLLHRRADVPGSIVVRRFSADDESGG